MGSRGSKLGSPTSGTVFFYMDPLTNDGVRGLLVVLLGPESAILGVLALCWTILVGLQLPLCIDPI